MVSKAKRKKSRAKRARRVASNHIVDPHVAVATGAISAMFTAMSGYAGTSDPAAAVEEALTELVSDVAADVEAVELASLIEVARLGALSWAPIGTVGVYPEMAPPRAELLALVAVAASAHAGAPVTPAAGTVSAAVGGVQPVTNLVNGKLFDQIDEVLRLAQIRELASADPSDPLVYVSALMRGAEIWIRNITYPDMLKATVLALFSDPTVVATLKSDLGFTAEDAIEVLAACHELQVDRVNDRMVKMRDAMDAARASADPTGAPNEKSVQAARAAWTSAWEGTTDQVAVSVADIVAKTGRDTGEVEAVLKYFTVDLDGATPQEVVDEYTSGNNPLRTHPVIAVDNRYMLIHDTQNLGAVRENLEQHLKGTTSWEVYQKLRGELLETRTQDALKRILPTADFRDGFEYYVPVSHAEEALPPSKYTKRVEGDHLVLIDDVAIIIEDKAVAVAPTSRSGETRRLRRDLTGIVTKAADQSGRLRERIVKDKGVQVHGEGWVDLAHIREIHTIAVSLDDLTSVSTATAHLVAAGILDIDNIPWTVSTHDLDLITQIVDHPAEFLLYLRRRRNAQTTVMYTAPDELDLFLNFYASGLWVEPDPDSVRAAFPWLPAVKTAERRRYEKQVPAFLTSHTDELDQWYYGRLTAASHHAPASAPLPPKPAMAPTALRPLINKLQAMGTYGWLSTSATLLSGSDATQAKFARVPHDLLENPFGDGRRRSQTSPWPAPSVEEGWLLAWVTLPVAENVAAFEKDTREYLRMKMHQLGMPRGAVFVFSEATKDLVDFYFDDHIGPLDPALVEKSQFLMPPEAMTGQLHPDGKKRPGSRAKRPTKKGKRKRRK